METRSDKSVGTVFRYDSVTSYLAAVRHQHPRRKGRQTLARWAKSLGYRSATSLGMVLNGQRPPTTSLVKRLAKDLRLTQNEAQYLALLAQRSSLAAKGKRDDDVESELRRLNPLQHPRRLLGADDLARVSRWSLIALRHLIELPTFDESPQWIFQKLRRKVDRSDIKLLLARLLSCGLVSRDEGSGKLKAESDELINSIDESPSVTLRKLHGEFITLAREALDEQPVDEREFGAVTLAFTRDQLPEAKRMLKEFREAFLQRFSGKAPDSVYQLNLQFFSLTKQD